jgi:DNA-binding response OmpR family regulator
MQPIQIMLLDSATGGRELLARLLRMCGFGVTEAATGDEARLAALTRRFDLLITEISPPDRAEFSLNKLLAHLHGTKGIVLTAYDPKDVCGWRQAGFAMLFKKPIDFDRLIAGVRQLTSGARHNRWDSLNGCRGVSELDAANYIGTQAAGLMGSAWTN